MQVTIRRSAPTTVLDDPLGPAERLGADLIGQCGVGAERAVIQKHDVVAEEVVGPRRGVAGFDRRADGQVRSTTPRPPYERASATWCPYRLFRRSGPVTDRGPLLGPSEGGRALERRAVRSWTDQEKG